MRWFSRESCSERRFSGWWKWLKDMACIAALAGFASELAAAREAAVLFDITTVVLLWPMMAIGMVLLLAWTCKRLWNVSFIAALAGLEPYLPLILLVPVLEMLGGESGFHTEAAFAGVGAALSSLVTGGLVPMTAPFALTIVWVGVLTWIAYSWWRSTPAHTPLTLGKALAPAYFLFPLIALIPSVIGWLLLFGHVPLWKAPASLVEQAFITSHIDGYAWRAIYERFPLALKGEAHVSTQWFFLALGFSSLTTLMFVHLRQGLGWSFRRVYSFVGAIRIRRIIGTIVLGMVFALMFEPTPVWGWTHLLAGMVLLGTLLFALLHEAAHTDLVQAIDGSLPAHRPLASGEVRANDLQAWADSWMAGSLIGAWLLGWPVFLAYLLALAASREALRLRSRWTQLGFQAISHIGYVLVGWMTVVERGSFGPLAPALALLIALAILVASRWHPSRQRPLT